MLQLKKKKGGGKGGGKKGKEREALVCSLKYFEAGPLTLS